MGGVLSSATLYNGKEGDPFWSGLSEEFGRFLYHPKDIYIYKVKERPYLQVEDVFHLFLIWFRSIYTNLSFSHGLLA